MPTKKQLYQIWETEYEFGLREIYDPMNVVSRDGQKRYFDLPEYFNNKNKEDENQQPKDSNQKESD